MKKWIQITLSFAILLLGCKPDTSGQLSYEVPQELDDGILTGTLAEADMVLDPLTGALNDIRKGKFREIHSILIYRNNRLVFEEYFEGHKYQWNAPNHHAEWVKWDRDMLHHIMSDSKSITSACIGIAIDKGFIKGVDQSIFEYLPDYQRYKTESKEKITIEHLLTMTSGFDRDEWTSAYSNTSNPIIALWFSPCEDPLSCILSAPMAHTPGAHFTYYGGSQILLGEILKNASGMDIDEFSQQYLFKPLGIDSIDWAVRFPNDVIEAAGGLKLRPRDMLKIGITYLNDGVWDDQQVISSNWVDRSGTPFGYNRGINVPGTDSRNVGYSYSWWTFDFYKSGTPIKGYYAGGWGGQRIIVLPALDAVVVITGGTYTSKTKVNQLLQKYIIKSMQ